MVELTKSQKSRIAIRTFITTADALALRGFYKPSGRSGQTLSDALKMISPEIYGSMNDPRMIELKGLEYIIDRLPRGIESCRHLILTAQDEFAQTSFERIQPLKRRRPSYRVGEHEMCFIISTGLSQIYDILTHVTFLNIEAHKIFNQVTDKMGMLTNEWKHLEKTVEQLDTLTSDELDKAIWNLSIILGRTFLETKETYDYLESNRLKHQSNDSLFQIIYRIGHRVQAESIDRNKMLTISFTPALKDMIGHNPYSSKWANSVKKKIISSGLEKRPLHIISANLHSIRNILYGYAAAVDSGITVDENDIYQAIETLRDSNHLVQDFAEQHGFHELTDISNILLDCQLIDTKHLVDLPFHPQLRINPKNFMENPPLIFVMDYAFGTQAFDTLDRLLEPCQENKVSSPLNVQSISIMGKAGILSGKKGDIMLAKSHVFEGTPDNYIFENDIDASDFDGSIPVFQGPIVTVFGTSLQNRDILEKFKNSSWKAIGLEMEGGHYQRAISAAIIKSHISPNIKIRYAYYASDNPLLSGQTLASGSMGSEGIKPTYMISKAIVEKIMEQPFH
ncbi:hypothetical protein MHK_001417 [Candidatus Magnetomorum sp. HK-1]|nr:hypothetical protein MHK_001417 [Candidatus Magnetomorum sp. HK-1]